MENKEIVQVQRPNKFSHVRNQFIAVICGKINLK